MPQQYVPGCRDYQGIGAEAMVQAPRYPQVVRQQAAERGCDQDHHQHQCYCYVKPSAPHSLTSHALEARFQVVLLPEAYHQPGSNGTQPGWPSEPKPRVVSRVMPPTFDPFLVSLGGKAHPGPRPGSVQGRARFHDGVPKEST